MRYGPALLAVALLGAAPMTPMTPGFHQRLQCNAGYVTVAVAAAEPMAGPHVAAVPTTVAIGAKTTVTTALRTLDPAGNIYALGYVLAPHVLKLFPKRLLLPASPPAAGAHGSYFSVAGVVIEKRFAGTVPGGYVFSDYLAGRKLNSVTYAPGVGITRARFMGLLPGGNDFICRLPGA
jgi:hypothetical protein